MLRPRLLFYAVDGLGLGHVTRMLALARAIRRLSPDAEMLFLTTSEASHVIYQEGFAALKLPSRAAASNGGLRGGSWLRLMQTVAWNAVAAFDPHCLIVDTFAAGTLQELLPILRWPLRKVFVFRAQRPERAVDSFLQRTLELYDLILVPHEPDSEIVPTPAFVRTLWTGTMLLRDADELLPRREARRTLGLPLERDIGLFALGGGGEPEMETARVQMQRAVARAQSETLWVEVAGPLSRDAWSSANPTVAKASGEDISPPHEYSCGSATDEEAPANGNAGDAAQWRTLHGVHPLMIFLHAFDCAVAAAGYNTTHELQAARVPCVLWPFARDLDDQAARAHRLAQAGRALCIGEGSGVGGEHHGDAADATDASGKREDELASAVRELARPDARQRLRGAERQVDSDALSNDLKDQLLWRNGATAGAEAVLKLLP